MSENDDRPLLYTVPSPLNQNDLIVHLENKSSHTYEVRVHVRFGSVQLTEKQQSQTKYIKSTSPSSSEGTTSTTTNYYSSSSEDLCSKSSATDSNRCSSSSSMIAPTDAPTSCFQAPTLTPGTTEKYQFVAASSNTGCSVTVCLSALVYDVPPVGGYSNSSDNFSSTGRTYVLRCATPSWLGRNYVKGFEDWHMCNEEIHPESYAAELNSPNKHPEHYEGNPPRSDLKNGR
jgi:hypothetical protein